MWADLSAAVAGFGADPRVHTGLLLPHRTTGVQAHLLIKMKKCFMKDEILLKPQALEVALLLTLFIIIKLISSEKLEELLIDLCILRYSNESIMRFRRLSELRCCIASIPPPLPSGAAELAPQHFI